MNIIHRLLIGLVGALLAPLLLVVPVHADDPQPAPQTPLEVCQLDRDHWRTEATYWRGQAGVYEELYDAYRVSHERMAGVAEQWQLRAVSQAATIERQRGRLEHQRSRVEQLRARVAELRERLAARR